MMLATRTPDAPLTVVHAARTVVTARDPAGVVQIYVATPVGWRLRREPARTDGDLITEPLLESLLDAAAVSA